MLITNHTDWDLDARGAAVVTQHKIATNLGGITGVIHYIFSPHIDQNGTLGNSVSYVVGYNARLIQSDTGWDIGSNVVIQNKEERAHRLITYTMDNVTQDWLISETIKKSGWPLYAEINKIGKTTHPQSSQ